MDKNTYMAQVDASRPERIRWWNDARFGMFVHWGLYSQIGRHEWVMNRERIPVAEYEKLADTWQVMPESPATCVGPACEARRHEIHGDDHQTP